MENQQQQTTEVTIVLSSELEAVVKENNSIELTKAQSHALAFAPSMDKVNELSKALATMNKENPSETEAKIARRCRLDLVPVRTGADKIKKELKAGILREEKLIDSLYGVIKNTSELIEAEYEKIEKFAENREKERKEKLFTARKFLLDEYTDQASIYPLGDMDEDSFNQLLDAMKLQKEAKEDAARKAQAEKEKADIIEKLRWERSEIIKPLYQFFEDDGSVKLGEITQEAFDALLVNLQAKKKAHDDEIEAKIKENEKLKEQAAIKAARTSELMPFVAYIRDFNALLSLDEEDYQLQFADIRKGAMDDMNAKTAEEEAKIKRTESAYNFLLQNGFRHSSGGVTSIEFKHFIPVSVYSNFENDEALTQFKERIQSENIRDKKAKDQEIENARLAKELQDKKDKELQEANEKIVADKAKAKSEKELLKSGDKIRINAWIDKIILPEIDTKGMTEESIAKVNDIIDKVEKMKAWAKTEAEKF